MVANILPADPHHPLTFGMGSIGVKIQLFQNMVTLHINLMETQMQQHSSKYFTPPPPDPGGHKVKIQLLQNMVMLHIKLKGIRYAATW